MLKFNNLVTLIGALTLPLAVGVAHADLVVNGGFDANNPAPGTAPLGWTLVNAPSGSNFFVGPGPGLGVRSLPNSANFAATGLFDDSLSQVLATVPGQAYTFSFFLGHLGSNVLNDFSASWNGSSLVSFVNAGTFNYASFSFIQLATSASTTVEFDARDGETNAWYELDDVKVQPGIITPEPGFLLLLCAGFAALMANWYLKSRRSQVRSQNI
jgi:hypothetical protein